ncbi:Phosphatidylglycerol/phosphatidylinositol transfer protein [Scheffersomyces spartinae]|uniref:Phosphatidylglycerol/phosphatidylinositol transfer protein n=1 Tax=Scheffersomyces spartinae TaxID=45513 RepID=A0A9P7VBG5_9ASCO|nr:Phosphatidylglycerol/phosphatidylinositol transfer protein [Scheffersomyces spartinae]KAG7194899.1 Phosphatidylglycerol/phosphatidylinositol transfer protein [Scheffersomyces spartinae]
MVTLKKAVQCAVISSLIAPALGLSFVPLVNKLASKVVKVFEIDEPKVHEWTAAAFPGNDKDEKPVPGGSPIMNCDASVSQLLSLHSVVISPNPPERGQNLTFIAKGYLDKPILDGAYVEVDVKYGFIKLIHQTFDLCEEITKVDLSCPVADGEQVIVKEVEVPQEVPPGQYIVNARAYTKDDEFITCLSAVVDFPAA